MTININFRLEKTNKDFHRQERKAKLFFNELKISRESLENQLIWNKNFKNNFIFRPTVFTCIQIVAFPSFLSEESHWKNAMDSWQKSD